MFKYTSLNAASVSGYRIFGRSITEKRLWAEIFIAAYAIITLGFFASSALFPSKVKIYHSASKTHTTYSSLSKSNYKEVAKTANIDILNSSAIFNEVENAVKQKNADLNPISVSFFPAYVPEGTFLYHSNRNGQIPSSLEWTAMDYEFSYNFAHFPRANGRRRGGGPGGPPGKDKTGSKNGGPPDGGKGGPGGPPGKGGKHGPGGGGPPGFGDGTSSLMTFQVTKPLDKLIYLGGASAAKTQSGEMDTQFLLSQMPSYDDFNEYTGAKLICDWGNSNGRQLDGIIRLEVGFEIIMCSFTEKLQLVQNATLSKTATELAGFPKEKEVEEETTEEDGEEAQGNDETEKSTQKRDTEEAAETDELEAARAKVLDHWEIMAGYDHYTSGEYVYNGDPRIYLDFSKFVTVLNKTYVSPDSYTRRIHNISSEVNTTLLGEIDEILRGDAFDPYSTTNWEVVTHRIVKKFAPPLMTMNVTLGNYLQNYEAIFDKKEQSVIDVSKQLDLLGSLGTNLTTWTFNLVRRYSDYHYDNVSEEQIKDLFEMWVWDYVHPYQAIKTDSDFLIWSSITNVQTELVNQLYSLYELGKKIVVAKYVDNNETTLLDLHPEIVDAAQKLADFLALLDWSIFYQCTKACGFNEICFIPTWGPSPIGWGRNSDLPLYETGEDGVSRIKKDLICLSPDTMLSIKA